MKRETLLLLFPLFMLLALALAPTAGAAENDVYAILYANRTLVFQYGDAPESGRTVTETYPVNLNGYWFAERIPWYDRRDTVRTVVFKDAIQPVSMAYWFCGFSLLESIQNLDKVDTSRVASMRGLFSGCAKFEEMDLRGLDTSAVTDMSGMFSGCANLASLDVSGWNTSNVTNMYGVFDSCKELTTLDVSGWDTSNVKSMSWMFAWCTALTTLDVSGWNTSNVRNMERMFSCCSSLTTFDVSGWDTYNVTNMEETFSYCEALTTLDISGWDTVSVTNMKSMFYNSNKLRTIYVSEFFNACSNSGAMFAFCRSLIGGAGTRFSPAHTDMGYARIDKAPDAPGYFTEKKAERPPVALILRGSSGEEVTLDDLRDGAEIVPEVTLEEDALKTTADIFLAIYDSQGMMIALQSWEVDLSNPLSFIQTAAIPPDKDASYVKFIMLSSNLTPLTAAQALQ